MNHYDLRIGCRVEKVNRPDERGTIKDHNTVGSVFARWLVEWDGHPERERHGWPWYASGQLRRLSPIELLAEAAE